MTDLCVCLGRSVYEVVTEAVESRRGCHDHVWAIDDKASVYYYTGENYQTINEFLRNQLNPPYSSDDSKLEIISRIISAALIKTDAHTYDTVFRWENNVPVDISQIKVGDIVGYSSFVSTSVDSNFDFNKSKPRKLTIINPVGAYIADYSQATSESELLINKGAIFRVESVNEKENTATFRQLHAEEAGKLVSDLNRGKVA
ncbi:ADP-ribosyltransferase [Enterobacter cloacae]|uniref:ADP-ribosyltransferase n=1 Tax=Enterobacter TaxID=547 RepID=UPI002002B44A|nr:ADP-ribosyltransferase [Enterobacter cloacae]ELK7439003.1 hypothetical protein [Enterobacter cloacae]MCK7316876.1 ADP-ribosyltransferase [Enterobacter cloacae]